MCLYLNPRPLGEIDAARARVDMALTAALGSADLDRIHKLKAEQEDLDLERQARLRAEHLDGDGQPLGYADTPPAVRNPAVDRMANLRLMLLRVRSRVCADCGLQQEIDTAIAELAAIRQELGLGKAA